MQKALGQMADNLEKVTEVQAQQSLPDLPDIADHQDDPVGVKDIKNLMADEAFSELPEIPPPEGLSTSLPGLFQETVNTESVPDMTLPEFDNPEIDPSPSVDPPLRFTDDPLPKLPDVPDLINATDITEEPLDEIVDIPREKPNVAHVPHLPPLPKPEPVPAPQPAPIIGPDTAVKEQFTEHGDDGNSIAVLSQYGEETRRWRANILRIMRAIIRDLQTDNAELESLLRHFELDRRTPL